MIKDESVFNKWRCLIAFAHIDKIMHPDEKSFLIKHMKKLGPDVITKEQQKILIDDFSNPKEPDVFFIRIDSRVEKLDLLRLAHALFWADGHLDAREKRTFEYIRDTIASSLDIEPDMLDKMAKVETNKNRSLKDILVHDLEAKKDKS